MYVNDISIDLMKIQRHQPRLAHPGVQRPGGWRSYNNQHAAHRHYIAQRGDELIHYWDTEPFGQQSEGTRVSITKPRPQFY